MSVREVIRCRDHTAQKTGNRSAARQGARQTVGVCLPDGRIARRHVKFCAHDTGGRVNAHNGEVVSVDKLTKAELENI